MTSGSVITVGEGGPRFEVRAARNHHQASRRAACRHAAVFSRLRRRRSRSGGRRRRPTWPTLTDYTRSGRLHFSLSKRRLGEEGGPSTRRLLRPGCYAGTLRRDRRRCRRITASAVNSGSEFRLGNDDGPTFGVTITSSKGGGDQDGDRQSGEAVRHEVKVTNRSSTRPAAGWTRQESRRPMRSAAWPPRSARRCLRLSGICGTRKTCAQLAAISRRRRQVDQEIAEETIPKAAAGDLAAVYLVAKMENGDDPWARRRHGRSGPTCSRPTPMSPARSELRKIVGS